MLNEVAIIDDIKYIRFERPDMQAKHVEDKEGQKLVREILVRKGQPLIKQPNGRLRPVAKTIMDKNMIRLKANENPADIVRDMQVQLLLL